jgi:putative membrane protein
MSNTPSRAAVVTLAFALLAATTSVSFAMSDQAFLKSAIEGDNSEVQLGMLAETSGGSQAVKSFGQTLEGDHAKARIAAVKLADGMGMTAPTNATSEAMEEMNKLKGLTGASFDKEFADYMIRDHHKDISDFRSEAKSGEGPVARFAQMSIPTLEKHLHIAESIANSGT